MTVANIKNRHRKIHLQWSRIAIGLLMATLAGCQSQASNEQLDQWHKETIAENIRLTQANTSGLSKDWKLTIQGEIQKPITLDWMRIEKLATTQLITQEPHSNSLKTPVTFRGISVKDILEKAGVQSGVDEVTIVASDAYYSTMPLKQLNNQQALLATLKEGSLIRRNEGGPLYMVYYNNPKVNPDATDQQHWVYYVTHLIVGTEPLRLKVGSKSLKRVDLEKLPSHKMTTLVGYKIGWSSEPVQLVGVRIRDILRSQKLTIPKQSILKVRRKSMDDRDPQKSVLLTASLIDRCDVMLAYAFGADAQPIPASKGGPLTLAYGQNCPNDVVKKLAWLPFVESLSIEAVPIESTSKKP
jgi:DMSO/TMAO reductase YedYZ molybdopterin-dependent catalytic subunit